MQRSSLHRARDDAWRQPAAQQQVPLWYSIRHGRTASHRLRLPGVAQRSPCTSARHQLVQTAAVPARGQPPAAVATSTPPVTLEPDAAAAELPEEPSAPVNAAPAAPEAADSFSVTDGAADTSSLLVAIGAASASSTAAQQALSRRPSLQDIQAATSDKLAELQNAVAEAGSISSTEQLSQVLHQLEELEHNLSEALQQHQLDEQASAATTSTATTAAAAPATAPVAAAPAADDAYLVVDDALTTLTGSQLPLTGAFDPQLKVASVTPAVPEPSVMAGALPMTAAASTAAVGAAHGPLSSRDAEAVAGVPGEVTAASSSDTAPAATAAADSSIDSTKLWALFVLGLSYVHQASTGFALPALLPMISPSLHLSDFQGALLTSGYSYLYALALVPVGLLADRVKRPQLLAVGLVLWSSLSIAASGAKSFSDLLLTRIGFAAAQATQNPVSFSLIPDLFPANKSTALAGYNCAIYLGRALSFAGVLAAHRLGEGAAMGGSELGPPAGDIALSMVPLDGLDLQRMSIIYTTGDMAAVTPVYNYNFNVIAYEAAASGMGGDGWRQLLTYLAYPGFLIAGLMMLSVKEPRDEQRQKQQQQQQQQQQALQEAETLLQSTSSSLSSLGSLSSISDDGTALPAAASSSDSSSSSSSSNTGVLQMPPALADWRTGVSNLSQKLPLDVVNRLIRQGSIAARRTAAALRGASGGSRGSSSGAAASGASLASVERLIKMPAFQTTTIAAALNDVGSYALIAWHSTFYERVYHLDSSVYAPMLAIILPVGGILGGLGGGLIGDWLSVKGGRQWLTAGASVMAAPFITQSLLAENSSSSFLALLAGFALSEAWRAPSAIMIRSVAPQELGSTASALYLCIRNLVGGMGPVAVAKLAEVVGLQHAMLLAPSCYVLSGLLFLLAEKEIMEQQRQQQMAAELQALQPQQPDQQQGQGQQQGQPAVVLATSRVVPDAMN